MDTKRRRTDITKHEDEVQVCTFQSQKDDVADYDLLIPSQPMAWPDRISVYHKIRTAPAASTDSFVLDVLILSERHQRPAATCVEDIVVYDYRRGAKTHLKDFMLDKFKETFELQEESKTRNERRVGDLLDRVQRLEKQSWDRLDAVEDAGSS